MLAPGLRAVFCGINPGRASATAGAHFANSRNDFWRLLRDADFTPRLFEPGEQFALLDLGYGLTNAAQRTTRGASELRRRDFAGARLFVLSSTSPANAAVPYAERLRWFGACHEALESLTNRVRS